MTPAQRFKRDSPAAPHHTHARALLAPLPLLLVDAAQQSRRRAMAAAAPLDGAAAAAPVVVVDFCPFGALPLPLALKIFAALPADTRLSCAELCRDWRAMLNERSLWTRLDLSATSGVTHEVTPALLRDAVANAGGALQALGVSGDWRPLFEAGALRTAVAANAGTLRELRCLRQPGLYDMRVSMLEALLSAAPQLRVCQADVLFISDEEARRALRNEGVFGSLRVHTAWLHIVAADAAAHASLCADVAAHASLTELALASTPLDVPELLDAFVDAALSLPLLRTVKLSHCYLSPASAPALARLLGSGTLTEFVIEHDDYALLNAPSAALLGGALRANATLTSLTLRGARLWSDHAAAAALLGALTGHASLRKLAVTADALRSRKGHVHNGVPLGALVAADTPALTELDVCCGGLGNAGLRPLFEALPRNSHLRTLNCSYNKFSDACARDVLLPAVRANTSLRTLITRDRGVERQSGAAREVEALVKSRGEDAPPAV
jgi:hypothetical protein